MLYNSSFVKYTVSNSTEIPTNAFYEDVKMQDKKISAKWPGKCKTIYTYLYEYDTKAQCARNTASDCPA